MVWGVLFDGYLNIYLFYCKFSDDDDDRKWIFCIGIIDWDLISGLRGNMIMILILKKFENKILILFYCMIDMYD